MKKAILILILLTVVSMFSFADVYKFDYVSTEDIDSFEFENKTSTDMLVRVLAGSRCDILPISAGKKESIDVDIEYEDSTITIPIQFECRNKNGTSISVTWLMKTTRNHDAIITLKPDEGWSF